MQGSVDRFGADLLYHPSGGATDIQIEAIETGPDGTCSWRGSEHGAIWLRYGSATGGSEGDRISEIEKIARQCSARGTPALFVHDGPEVCVAALYGPTSGATLRTGSDGEDAGSDGLGAFSGRFGPGSSGEPHIGKRRCLDKTVADRGVRRRGLPPSFHSPQTA